MNQKELYEYIEESEFSYLAGGEGIWVVGGSADEEGPISITSMEEGYIVNCMNMMKKQLDGDSIKQVEDKYRDAIKKLVIDKIKELKTYL